MRNISHMMIEIKSDMMLYKEIADIIKYVLSEEYGVEDEYLRNIVSDSYIPFGINRKIFEYSLKSIKNKGFLKISDMFAENGEWWEENSEILAEYHRLSLNAAIDIVNNFENAPASKYDPNGYEHLESLKELRKEYRVLKIKNYENNFYKIPDELKKKGE